MRRIAVIAVAVFAFLAASTGVARWLTADNAERDRVETLLRAQARGDAGAMLRALDRCGGGCAVRVRANATRLRRPGALEIARYDSSTSHALGADTGQTRVVWKTPTTLTVVQCVTVRRSGNPIRGIDVELLGISAPIGRQSSC
jgi:hypothetical protein